MPAERLGLAGRAGRNVDDGTISLRRRHRPSKGCRRFSSRTLMNGSWPGAAIGLERQDLVALVLVEAARPAHCRRAYRAAPGRRLRARASIPCAAAAPSRRRGSAAAASRTETGYRRGRAARGHQPTDEPVDLGDDDAVERFAHRLASAGAARPARCRGCSFSSGTDVALPGDDRRCRPACSHLAGIGFADANACHGTSCTAP